MNDFISGDNLCGLSAEGVGRQDKQLNTYDYLADIPGNNTSTDIVEVQFKNTHKGYFRNENLLNLEKGDMVAVESSPGHDIGVVSLTGKLVLLQMRKNPMRRSEEIRRIYRVAKPIDIEKYEEAKSNEQETMIATRKICQELKLDMKISDVEYQGDGNKAIFYYIADNRVDFRQLIKVLAERFCVRIEMRQIGSRQEASCVGGIGPCGRELCCATWMRNFSTVTTGAARCQNISLNPQKLAGQCGKLKCCLNYEMPIYKEALMKMPSREMNLDTKDCTFYFFKSDILSNLVTYSTDRRMAANLVTISAERAKEIIKMNKEGEKPLTLAVEEDIEEDISSDLLDKNSLTRFDKSKKKNKRRNNSRNKKENITSNNISPAVSADISKTREGGSATDSKRQNNNKNSRPNRNDRIIRDGDGKKNVPTNSLGNNKSEEKGTDRRPSSRSRRPYSNRQKKDSQQTKPETPMSQKKLNLQKKSASQSAPQKPSKSEQPQNKSE